MMGDFSDRVGLDWITLDAKITSGVGGSRQHSKEGWCPYNLLPWGGYWLRRDTGVANLFCCLQVVPVDYCATIGEVWLEKGRCISSVVDRFTSCSLFFD